MGPKRYLSYLGGIPNRQEDEEASCQGQRAEAEVTPIPFVFTSFLALRFRKESERRQYFNHRDTVALMREVRLELDANEVKP